MEAPLNKKVDRLQARFVPDVARPVLVPGAGWVGRPVPSQSIWAQYEEPETVQPNTEALRYRELPCGPGMPLTTVLRDEGWDEEDLAQMEEDKQAERVAQASYADAVLSQAQRQFDAGSVV